MRELVAARRRAAAARDLDDRTVHEVVRRWAGRASASTEAKRRLTELARERGRAASGRAAVKSPSSSVRKLRTIVDGAASSRGRRGTWTEALRPPADLEGVGKRWRPTYPLVPSQVAGRHFDGSARWPLEVPPQALLAEVDGLPAGGEGGFARGSEERQWLRLWKPFEPAPATAPRVPAMRAPLVVIVPSLEAPLGGSLAEDLRLDAERTALLDVDPRLPALVRPKPALACVAPALEMPLSGSRAEEIAAAAGALWLDAEPRLPEVARRPELPASAAVVPALEMPLAACSVAEVRGGIAAALALAEEPVFDLAVGPSLREAAGAPAPATVELPFRPGAPTGVRGLWRALRTGWERSIEERRRRNAIRRVAPMLEAPLAGTAAEQLSATAAVAYAPAVEPVFPLFVPAPPVALVAPVLEMPLAACSFEELRADAERGAELDGAIPSLELPAFPDLVLPAAAPVAVVPALEAPLAGSPAAELRADAESAPAPLAEPVLEMPAFPELLRPGIAPATVPAPRPAPQRRLRHRRRRGRPSVLVPAVSVPLWDSPVAELRADAERGMLLDVEPVFDERLARVALRAPVPQVEIPLERPAVELPAPAPAPAPARERVVKKDRRPVVGPWVARFAALVIFAACGLNIFFLRWENFGYFWYRPFLNAYSIGVAAFILSRFLIALFYRPPKDVGLEPTVSIIITAFNEEDAVYRTIECCYAADYPRHKVQVIAVNDGSTDGTARELARAQQTWPDLVVDNFPENRGKREAMAAGARVSTGEILIYVDSDSFIAYDSIRKLVQGFADPRVAAIAGQSDVANADVNLVTRMQDARYYVAFRVFKAAESVFGAVTCCPGCFSAYRKSCLMQVLEPWLNQRFLGVRATFGDDRSLTNFLLRNYRVIFASNALCTTIVPETHRAFLKQQVRWKKSWLRECSIASTFIWKKHPIAAISFYAQLIFPFLAPIMLLRAFLWVPFVNGDPLSMILYAYGSLLIGFTLSATYLFGRADGNWIYAAYFTVYYMFVLVWQMPYAIATSRDNRWGTR